MSSGPHAQISERRFNSVRIIDRKIHAARAPAFMMVLLHREADRAVVDDRNHLAQMLRE